MSYSHILVASDGSERSARAVGEAARLAAALGARLTVLTVERQPRMPVRGIGEPLNAHTLSTLAEVAHQQSKGVLAEALTIAAEAGVKASTECPRGIAPSRAILAAADRLPCDLIVMASHGRRGLQGMVLGSHTQRVLVQARVPVLVIH